MNCRWSVIWKQKKLRATDKLMVFFILTHFDLFLLTVFAIHHIFDVVILTVTLYITCTTIDENFHQPLLFEILKKRRKGRIQHTPCLSICYLKFMGTHHRHNEHIFTRQFLVSFLSLIFCLSFRILCERMRSVKWSAIQKSSITSCTRLMYCTRTLTFTYTH